MQDATRGGEGEVLRRVDAPQSSPLSWPRPGEARPRLYESVLERRDNSAMQHQRVQLSGLRVALLT